MKLRDKTWKLHMTNNVIEDCAILGYDIWGRLRRVLCVRKVINTKQLCYFWVDRWGWSARVPISRHLGLLENERSLACGEIETLFQCIFKVSLISWKSLVKAKRLHVPWYKIDFLYFRYICCYTVQERRKMRLFVLAVFSSCGWRNESERIF